MSDPEADGTADWTTVVGRLSFGVGALYLVGYNVYVLTRWDPSVFLPPVLAFASLWAWRRETVRVDRDSVLRIAWLFVLVVPAGAVVVEVLFLFGLGLAFELFGALPPVAWYQRQWLDVTGFTGPVHLLAYTLLTVMVASTAALVVRAAGAAIADRVR